MTLRDQTAAIAILTAAQSALKDALETAKTGDLRDAMILNREETGGKTVEIDVPGLGKVGRVTLPENQDSVKVTNQTAYAAWMEANKPGSTEWVLVVKPAVQKKHLEALELSANYETGEVVDLSLAEQHEGVAPRVAGVTAQKGEGFGTPTVTVAPADKARIVDAFSSQRLLELMPGQTPEAEPFAESRIVDVKVVHTAESLKPLKRPELVDLCHRQGLDHVGTLPALRQRILDAQAAADDTAADVA